MAGSHKSGVEAASDRLLENAYYVLTPAPGTPPEKVERLTELLSLTRAKVVQMDADTHDQVVGAVSHFPHVLASALVNLVAGYDEENGWHARLAAGGFRDITRIASSNPRMWRDVLLQNREPLLKIAKDWTKALEDVIELVEEGDPEGIERFFQTARDFRDGLPERKAGALPPLNDLYIDIPDHPGRLAASRRFWERSRSTLPTCKSERRVKTYTERCASPSIPRRRWKKGRNFCAFSITMCTGVPKPFCTNTLYNEDASQHD